MNLADAEQVFRALSKLHYERRYRDGAQLAFAHHEHQPELPVNAMGLWIGINGSRCAMAAHPGDDETRQLVRSNLHQIVAMRDVDLDETSRGRWVAPKWDERAEAAVAEFDRFL